MFTCLRAHVLDVLACLRACVVGVLACLSVCVVGVFACLRAYVLGVVACLACSYAWCAFVFECLTYVLAMMRAWHAQRWRTRVFV